MKKSQLKGIAGTYLLIHDPQPLVPYCLTGVQSDINDIWDPIVWHDLYWDHVHTVWQAIIVKDYYKLYSVHRSFRQLPYCCTLESYLVWTTWWWVHDDNFHFWVNYPFETVSITHSGNRIDQSLSKLKTEALFESNQKRNEKNRERPRGEEKDENYKQQWKELKNRDNTEQVMKNKEVNNRGYIKSSNLHVKQFLSINWGWDISKYCDIFLWKEQPI